MSTATPTSRSCLGGSLRRAMRSRDFRVYGFQVIMSSAGSRRDAPRPAFGVAQRFRCAQLRSDGPACPGGFPPVTAKVAALEQLHGVKPRSCLRQHRRCDLFGWDSARVSASLKKLSFTSASSSAELLRTRMVLIATDAPIFGPCEIHPPIAPFPVFSPGSGRASLLTDSPTAGSRVGAPCAGVPRASPFLRALGADCASSRRNFGLTPPCGNTDLL